jgi:hypothetical protein
MLKHLKKEVSIKSKNIIIMKNYYVADVNVFVDGKDIFPVKVAGLGYNPNAVKKYAEDKIREHDRDKIITSVILKKMDLDIEEYKTAIGANPSWLNADKNQ